MALPVVGHLHLLSPFIHQSFHKLSFIYGPLMYLRIESNDCIVASTPGLAEELLKTNELTFSARKHNAAIDHLTYKLQLLFCFRTLRTLMEIHQKGEHPDGFRTLVREVSQIFGEFNVSDVIWFCKHMDMQGGRKRFEDIHTRCSLDVQLTRTHIKALILALAELINNPEVLRKAHKEIDQVVGKDRLVQESDTTRLPYLQAVIKETFRLHPPIPMIIRKAIEECKINGYTIPAQSLSIARDCKGGEAAMIQCFEWKVEETPNTGSGDGCVDMTERPGLVVPRANDLKCVPVARFTPPLFAS
ncbi:hypothetical protein F3Y22_tig00004355pilonHSYRG00184 [Hibiscus syriacus]|uniref:Cytochrome P450 n=1 Tax=Hibiscus syriacus TaxID=106335 RepID=A0A6A3CLM8_HIBSY|nr:hypothetical protein F3Y22_tig00004355pilonHSYRG00184 [Hibiscus syriacus]